MGTAEAVTEYEVRFSSCDGAGRYVERWPTLAEAVAFAAERVQRAAEADRMSVAATYRYSVDRLIEGRRADGSRWYRRDTVWTCRDR
jgi:hypothetical protein